MKNILFSGLLLLCATTLCAQETYESATIADKDLNGTARYVGMGGAMEALGADISTINTNPAGIGLFRKGHVSTTLGVQNLSVPNSLGYNTTKFSFDQIGVVIPLDKDEECSINASFNYHKSKNFNSILSAANKLAGASQNKLSYLKGDVGVFYIDYDKDNRLIGWESETSDYTSNCFSQVDYLYYNNFLYDPADATFYYDNANSFEMGRYTRGSIQDFDFNLSTNFSNRVYLGLTMGIQSVDYKSESTYSEMLETGKPVALRDYRHIDGTGVNVKFGIIVRPIETSAFRIGGYIHTPTWYKLTTENTTSLLNGYTNKTMSISETYDFALNTPWTFGLSLGHTIGTNVALGATYEYSKYSALDNRVIDGGYYDYYGDYQEDSSSDHLMNECTEFCLKGVHTVKLGAEFKVTPQLALRAGYNYVSPKYNLEGYKDGTIDSYGTFYASQTDYINWKATNRFTCGIGYNFGNFGIDLAYQYSQTDGEYFPFMSYYCQGHNAKKGDVHEFDNICDKTDLSNKRHHISATFSYRF